MKKRTVKLAESDKKKIIRSFIPTTIQIIIIP